MILYRLTFLFNALTFVSLEYLDISKNDFSSDIPLQIGQLPSLTNFYAVDSGITGDLSFMEPMTQISKLCPCLVLS